jgi:hypothetical protein
MGWTSGQWRCQGSGQIHSASDVEFLAPAPPLGELFPTPRGGPLLGWEGASLGASSPLPLSAQGALLNWAQVPVGPQPGPAPRTAQRGA